LFWYWFVFWTNKNDNNTIIVVNDWHVVLSLGQNSPCVRKIHIYFYL
jgi:hypothetical protein